MRRLGWWIASADLVGLAADAAVDDAAARTAIARLKKRGILASARRHGVAGYELTAAGMRILERGDRHIFAATVMKPGDAWCVVSFSIPEKQRSRRLLLRKRLGQIGCGLLAPALWICPGHLRDEVEAILDDLHVWDSSVIFLTEDPITQQPIGEGIAKWWDLPTVSAAHSDFLARIPSTLPGGDDDSARFRRFVEIVDAWRPVPYVDPGLPLEHLSPDWPGRQSLHSFREAADTLADSAWSHVRSRVTVSPS